ncbi:glycosyltransferase [Natronohydrobacter thiooxidans]|uniref:glycosyltransferase n=1 Tax=Natronohydrobacter thiooxidans TaxID=87172 RepID=UPI0008FF5A78|nr:glycosyltransferase [Natronohydrobacter thiooxidans]
MHAPVSSTAPEPDHDPRVHVLLCTCNGAAWLGAQLDSLLAQSYPDWQLWISDDHSTDETLSILADFARHHPQRVAAIMDGPGQGSAANFLSLLCHPDLPEGYVALCDQDDVWLPHKLEHAMMRLRPMAGLPCAWSGRYVFTDAQMRPLSLPEAWPLGPSLENALVQNIMSGHTLTLNPEALALVRRAGPVAVPHHDWWIYLLLMACDAQALIDPEVVLHYRQHGRNTIGRRSGLRARAARLSGLMNGALRDWIVANLAALSQADLPLSPKASRLIALHEQAQGAGLHHLLRDFAIHRQNRSETLVLALAKRLQRL